MGTPRDRISEEELRRLREIASGQPPAATPEPDQLSIEDLRRIASGDGAVPSVPDQQQPSLEGLRQIAGSSTVTAPPPPRPSPPLPPEDEGIRRRDAILARQGFAPPDSGIPEFLPGVEPKPSALLGEVEQGLPRGDEITPQVLSAINFFQRNVQDPITGTALGTGFRPPRLIGAPGAVLEGIQGAGVDIPGITPGAVNPELIPFIGEDFRAELSQVPIGERIATDVITDPFNLPLIRAARLIGRGATAGVRATQATRPGLRQAAQQVGQVRPPAGVVVEKLGGAADAVTRGSQQMAEVLVREEARLGRRLRPEEIQAIGERVKQGLGRVIAQPPSRSQLALPPAPAPRAEGAVVSPGQVPQSAPTPTVNELLQRGGYKPPIQSAEGVRRAGESVARTMRGLANEFEGANEDLLARFGIDDIEDQLNMDLPRLANSDEVDPVAAARLLRSEADATERRLARQLRRMEEADITARETAIQRGLEEVANEPQAFTTSTVAPTAERFNAPLAAPVQETRPGIRQLRGGDIPFEASTPEEAAQFRQRVRELPAGQRTHIPPPEEVVTRPQAQEAFAKEFYDAVMDSPTDIAATAYFRSGKIVDYIRRTPKTFEVAEGFVEETFQEVGRASAFVSDPTRLVETIDLNGFGRALQRGLMWPTRRTVLASVNWGDATKVDFRKMLDRHGIRGTNPVRTRQKLDAAGDVLEEIGTNELDVGIDLLIAQTDNLLTRFSQVERVQIVNVALDTRRLMDNLLRIQNATRTRRGQSEIGSIQNYLPHIRQSNVWSRLGLSRLPSREITASLPPPDFIKPNTAFNPRALTRTGGLEGYEKIRNIERLINDYIESARKDIFYTNIIQNGKAHIRALRTRGGLENAAEAIEEWIMESYAGKLPAISRVAGKAGPARDAILLLRRSLTRAVFPLNWTWNAFVQTSSMGLTIKRYGVQSTLQGLDFMANRSARKAVRQNAYSSIIKRRGAGKAALQDVGPGIGDTAAVQRSALDTVEGAANFFTNIIEDNLTGISVRAAYHDGVRRGLSGRALWEYASEGGSKTQSMYNLEDLPGILRAKEVGAVFPFQTFAFEAMNTVRESGIPGLGRVGARVERNRMVSLFQFFGAIVATNVVIDKISGRSPWQISSFIPFWSVIGAGIDSGNTWNFPLPIKYIADLNKGIQDFTRHGNFNRLRAWALRYHMPGGTQIERMIRGIETVALNEGEVSNVAGDELFTIDVGSVQEVTKAIIGGIYTTSPGKEYVDQLQDAKGPAFRFTGIPIQKFLPLEDKRRQSVN